MKTVILLLTHKRPEYLRESLAHLRQTTPWWVPIVVEQDGADPETQAVIRAEAEDPGPQLFFSLTPQRHGTVGRAMASGITKALSWTDDDAALIKLDDDTVVPQAWYEATLCAITEARLRASMPWAVGLEPYLPNIGPPEAIVRRLVRAGRPIGGLFAAPLRAFTPEVLLCLQEKEGRYSGWEAAQRRFNFTTFWLDPGIPIVLLDRLPAGRWRDLGRQYEKEGIQRPWDRYTPEQIRGLNWFTEDQI